MTTWDEAVKFCKENYSNCYICPIRGACYEDHREDRRKSDDYVKDIINAIDKIKEKMTARQGSQGKV